MAADSPLDVLDEAIRTFSEAIGTAGAVGAWVLSYETSRIDPDNEAQGYVPVTYGTNYAIGPTGSANTALGLLRASSATLERLIVDSVLSDEDD